MFVRMEERKYTGLGLIFDPSPPTTDSEVVKTDSYSRQYTGFRAHMILRIKRVKRTTGFRSKSIWGIGIV